jgi:hypothetical protein
MEIFQVRYQRTGASMQKPHEYVQANCYVLLHVGICSIVIELCISEYKRVGLCSVVLAHLSNKKIILKKSKFCTSNHINTCSSNSAKTKLEI